MLELRNLTKTYAGLHVASNISFVARPGEVTGYLGPNGSGKSTTMKMITGLIQPTSGQVFFNGEDTTVDPMTYRQQMGYVPEEPYLYTHLSGIEYLVMVAQLRGMHRKVASEIILGLLSLFGLYSDRHVPMSSYSKGMRQKILLSAALLHNPSLVLLDEPFSGLDIGSSLVLRSLIEELARRGKTVLFSSHELETVERICSHVVILHRGKVVADDTIGNLRNLMQLPSPEDIFAQLAIEQDYVAVSREIVDLIYN